MAFTFQTCHEGVEIQPPGAKSGKLDGLGWWIITKSHF